MTKSLLFPEIGYKREIDWSSSRVQIIGDQFQYLGPYSPISNYVKITDSFSIDIVPITVIYGASGSGKSSVLRTIREKRGGFSLSEINVPEDYLINIIGQNVQEAISILSSVGLGQGHLFLSKYNELSDGQKFRLKLAYLLSKGEKIVYIDEFGSGLDIITAKNLAFTLSKYVRRNGIQAYICCNNIEVAEALTPEQIIELDYGYKTKVLKKDEITVLPKVDVQLQIGSIEDYYLLKKYHYLQDDGRMDGAKILVAKVEGKTVGVQVCTSAFSKRREKLHPFFKKVNDSILTGQRTIVHPEYNNCGIGKMLVTNAAKFFDYPIFELRSALFRFAPMPLNWGLKEYDNPYYAERDNYRALEKYIKERGFNSSFFISEEYARNLIDTSDCEELCELLKKSSDERHRYLFYYFTHLMKERGIEVPSNLSELLVILTSEDVIGKDDESIAKELVKHSDPIYRSFYYFN